VQKTYYRRHLPHYHPENAIFHVVFRLAGSLPAEVIEQLQKQCKEQEHEIKAIKNSQERSKQKQNCYQHYFERFESLLDGNSTGPTWLKEPEVAAIVKEALHHRDNRDYTLLAYCIMPNHVHMVCTVGRLGESTYNESSTVVRLPESTYNESSTVVRLPESTKPETGRDGVSTYDLIKILESLKKYTALRINRVLHRTGAFWQHESYDHVIRNDDELEKTIRYVLYNPVKAGLVNKWENWKWSYCKEN
jgi:REP element-mobilizing transposase RayT